jgi:hypothetical protein
MRQKREIQQKLCEPWPEHPLAQELRIMAQILEAHPVITKTAWQDLIRNSDSH